MRKTWFEQEWFFSSGLRPSDVHYYISNIFDDDANNIPKVRSGKFKKLTWLLLIVDPAQEGVVDLCRVELRREDSDGDLDQFVGT